MTIQCRFRGLLHSSKINDYNRKELITIICLPFLNTLLRKFGRQKEEKEKKFCILTESGH